MARVALAAGAVVVPWAVLTASADGNQDWVRLPLGLGAGAFFLLLAFLIETRSFRFDRTRRVLHWRRSRLLGSRSGSLPYSAIRAVVAQPRWDDDDSRRRRVVYRPVILTETGELPLSNTTSIRPEDFTELLDTVREAVGLRDVDGADVNR